MSDQPPDPRSKDLDPGIEEPPPDPAGEPGLDPAWWPNREESRAILADYVTQHDLGEDDDEEIPPDPDPGEED